MRVRKDMKHLSLLLILILIGCTQKMANYNAYKPSVDASVLKTMSTIHDSFISENIYYISKIDSLQNGVFVLWAIKEGKTYKILTHKLRDYEKNGDDFSDNKIEVGKSYPLYLQSWKETCRPKDLYEYSCAISGCEYHGNYVTINNSDVADLFFANYVDGLYLPK